MTLYFVGVINGLIIFSVGFITYKGYEIYNKQLLYKGELNDIKKNVSKFLNEKFIIYDELN